MQAEEKLIEGGMRAPEARALLQGVRALETDDEFWNHQSDGVAMFAARDMFHSLRLATKLEETVVVGDRFHIKPLLPLLQADGHFFLVAVSKHQVRLYQGTRYGVSEIETRRLPHKLASALVIDKKGPFHLLRTYGLFGDEQDPSLFHGHGGSGQEVQQLGELSEYFHRLNDMLAEYLHDESVPLVFAGVGYLFPNFRASTSYRHLVDTPITGNPEHYSAERLHHAAWELVRPLFLREQAEARERYGEYAVRGLASDDPNQVVPAAHQGRIDSLFVAAGESLSGAIEPATGEVVPQMRLGDAPEDLIDYAAAHTVLNRGKVYSVEPEEMPSEAPLAAIFRYALDWPSHEADRHERIAQEMKVAR